MKRVPLLFGITLFFSILPLGAASQSESAGVSSVGARVGAPAPAIDVADLDGKVRKLDEYAGKVVVIEWVNPGCPFVKKFYAVGRMQEWQAKCAAQGVVWLAVASTRAGHPEYRDAAAFKSWAAAQKAVPAAVLLDSDGAMARRYGAKTTPHMFVIGKDGKLAYAGAIDSIRSPKSEDIAKAVPYLMNAVDAACASKSADPAETKAYGCGVKL